VTEITDGSDVTTYSYDLAGNRTQLSLPNGVTSNYTYDDLSRVASQTTTNGNGTTVYDVSYSYDLVGNRVQVVEDVDGHSQRTIDYSYDGQYRLTEESWDSGNEKYEYEYDSIGNRLSNTVTENGGDPIQTQYSYDKLNRLTQTIEDADDDGSFETNGDDNVTNYTYDLNGNRTEKDVVGGATTTYSFDVHDRLTSASINSNTVFEADYDSRTRRVEKRSIGDGSPGDPLEMTVYRYDGGTSFHDLDGAGNMQVEVARGSGQGGGIGSILYTDSRGALGGEAGDTRCALIWQVWSELVAVSLMLNAKNDSAGETATDADFRPLGKKRSMSYVVEVVLHPEEGTA
jgi:YD repeat-containing protein